MHTIGTQSIGSISMFKTVCKKAVCTLVRSYEKCFVYFWVCCTGFLDHSAQGQLSAEHGKATHPM